MNRSAVGAMTMSEPASRKETVSVYTTAVIQGVALVWHHAHALTMTTLGDAILLRNCVIDALELADNQTLEDERVERRRSVQLLTFECLQWSPESRHSSAMNAIRNRRIA